MHEIIIRQSMSCMVPQLVEQRPEIAHKGKISRVLMGQVLPGLPGRVRNIVRHPSESQRMAMYYAGKCLSHDSVTAANSTGYQPDAYSLHIASIHEICGQCKKPANVGSQAKVIGWRPAV